MGSRGFWCLVQQVSGWFGMPQSFFGDKGPEFRSAVFHEICCLLGTSVKHSTANTPHIHGDVERRNRIFNDVLRTLSQERFPYLLAQWDEHIKLIQFTLSAAVACRLSSSFSGEILAHHSLLISLRLYCPAVDPKSLDLVLSFQNCLRQAWGVGREEQVQAVEAMDKLRDPTVQY